MYPLPASSYNTEKCEAELLLEARSEAHANCEAARFTKHQLQLTEESLNVAESKLKEQHTRIGELEQELEAYRSMKERSQVAVAGLQQVVRESQDQVVRLETRLRQLSENKEKDNIVSKDQTNEAIQFVKKLAQRLGLAEFSTTCDEIYSKVSDRLDQHALLDLQHAQSEAKLTKVTSELNKLQSSGTELSSRYEFILLEKKILTEKIASLEAKNRDLQSHNTLYQTCSESKEKQIQELQKQLNESRLLLEKEKQDAESHKFKFDMSAIQLRSLLESLAACLSTVEQPCAPTEPTVKEAVLRLLDQVKSMRENGAVFEGKVADLQKQFESQFKTGQVINAELKEARQRVREAESDKSQLETEVLGLKLLLHNQEEEKNTNKDLCKQLATVLGFGATGDEPFPMTELLHNSIVTLKQLIARGCLSQSCLTPINARSSCEHRPDQNGLHFHDLQNCSQITASFDRTISPTCDHHWLDCLLDKLRKQKYELTEVEVCQTRELCTQCLQQLILATWRQLQANKRCPVSQTATRPNAKEELQLKNLEMQLETERERVKTLSAALSVAEDKISKAAALDEAVDNLEKSRKMQAKRLEKFHKQMERDSLEAKYHVNELKTAKRLLSETQERKVRLSRFFDLIGRMVNVDTRFEPNPEMQIIQRIQQLLEVMRRAGIHQHPIALPYPTSEPVYAMPGVGGIPAGGYGMLNTAMGGEFGANRTDNGLPAANTKALPGTTLRQSNNRSVSFEDLHSRKLLSAPTQGQSGSETLKVKNKSKATCQEQSPVTNKRPQKRDERKY